MQVNHEYKFISISVPKTGSTSVHHGLMAASKQIFQAKNGAPAIYHLSATDIRSIMGEKNFQEYFSFGMVRNPFDRMVSLYHDFHDQRGAIKAKSFDDFVLEEFERRWKENVHFLPQEFFLCEGGAPIVSKVFKFEHGVDHAFDQVIEHVGLLRVDIGHARKSDRKDWEEYYHNGLVRDAVIRNYKIDFDTFGYEF